MNDFDKVRFITIEEAAGQRLDNFLLRELKGLPKSRIYRLIRKGEIRINKKRSKPETKLQQGDVLRIPPVRLAPPQEIPAPRPGLRDRLLEGIIAESDDFLVVNKPAGLSVHGGSGVRLGLIEAMRQLRPQWGSLELAHRLDRDTSGCLVLAKNPIFLRHLHEGLKAKTVEKTYLALVLGYWPDNLVEVNAALEKNLLQSGERMVRVSQAGKSSLTLFAVVQRFGRLATLVEARPETGRTHQIRVHCQFAGHPIVGDSKYSGDASTSFPVKVPGLCLHAAAIAFTLPGETARQRFAADLDPDFQALLNSLESQLKSVSAAVASRH
ncbi:MAG: hypothetical protein RLZZ385_159 [Pseudomonadota bacterium]